MAGHNDQGTFFFVIEDITEVAKLSEVDPVKGTLDKAVILMTLCTSQNLGHIRVQSLE